MPREGNRRGRADFAHQVAKVKAAAAEGGLDQILAGIESDPAAGPWREWARRLRAGDRDEAKPKRKRKGR